MSFHSYVHKLSDLHGKGTRSKNMLETLNYKINLDCHRHMPFPEGICTECRPPTVTLSRQPFRHVDNIEFEMTPFEVSLGIKAVVCAIYEPLQNSNENSVGFEINENGEENGEEEKKYLNVKVDQLCSWLGMKRIGWIFTDLWNESTTLGTVKCIRNEDSFLLSASECITAGNLQSHFKNATNYCDTGYFGSKFVTVVASGNSELNDISKYFNSFKFPEQFLEMASNFHFLLFLYTNNFVPFSKEEIKNLAQIVVKKDENEAKKWLQEITNFATLIMLIGEIGRQIPRTKIKTTTKTTATSKTNNNVVGDDSFLLSASECITAGNLQSHFKNATNYCDTGYFGSKFVTVVASGNSSKGIDLHGYQVSNQCTAMVEANILCPTKTHPELAWARETPLNEKHYITSVQYTEKNERGEEVFRDGRPMPVGYLLVDVPCGVRKVPNYTFPRGYLIGIHM
uniref:Uncharacterized protein n=1 Tax=Meloidogyne javanica TaxID=6303 RepID=A0A915LYZ9_MELJA